MKKLAMNFYKKVLLVLATIIIIPIIHAQNVFAMDSCGGADEYHVCLTNQDVDPDFLYNTGSEACAIIEKSCSGIEVSCHNKASIVDGISSTPSWEKSNADCDSESFSSTCVYRVACETSVVGQKDETCSLTKQCAEGFVCENDICVVDTKCEGEGCFDSDVDACSQSILSNIKVTPVKDDSVGFKIDISLPSGASISNASAVEMKNKKEIFLTCSSDDTVSLWNTTTTKDANDAKDTIYSCVTKDVKGDEILSLSFDYKDFEGNECSVSGENSISADLSKSETSIIDSSGGDCSLNPATGASGLGWIFELLVIGIPAAIFGFRRK